MILLPLSLLTERSEPYFLKVTLNTDTSLFSGGGDDVSSSDSLRILKNKVWKVR